MTSLLRSLVGSLSLFALVASAACIAEVAESEDTESLEAPVGSGSASASASASACPSASASSTAKSCTCPLTNPECDDCGDAKNECECGKKTCDDDNNSTNGETKCEWK
jgi:hypothetical protein